MSHTISFFFLGAWCKTIHFSCGSLFEILPWPAEQSSLRYGEDQLGLQALLKQKQGICRWLVGKPHGLEPYEDAAVHCCCTFEFLYLKIMNLDCSAETVESFLWMWCARPAFSQSSVLKWLKEKQYIHIYICYYRHWIRKSLNVENWKTLTILVFFGFVYQAL